VGAQKLETDCGTGEKTGGKSIAGQPRRFQRQKRNRARPVCEMIAGAGPLQRNGLGGRRQKIRKKASASQGGVRWKHRECSARTRPRDGGQKAAQEQSRCEHLSLKNTGQCRLRQAWGGRPDSCRSWSVNPTREWKGLAGRFSPRPAARLHREDRGTPKR